VSNAIQQLAAAPNYGWYQTFELPGGPNGLTSHPVVGKAQPDGLIWTSKDNLEKFEKGEKRAIKEQGGKWQTPDESLPARLARLGPSGPVTPPLWQLTNMLDKVQNLKETDGAYLGDLKPEDARTLVIYGGSRGGGGAPSTRGASPGVESQGTYGRRGGGSDPATRAAQSGSPVSAAAGQSLGQGWLAVQVLHQVDLALH